MNLVDLKICVVGLGYVGLPLAVEFGNNRETLGFDINKKRIDELKKNVDITLAITKKEIKESKFLKFSNSSNDLKKFNCYIVTVPTPIDNFNNPNLKPIIDASELIGNYLKKEDIIIYESTVYPGCTEEICVPLLEKVSKLKFNKDFFCGYSPERINPGDKNHKLKDIKKITSGSNNKIANLVDNLYKEIIPAGTYKAKNIKVAEAAKIIENTQRDINIALVNELSMLFNKMDIDTEAVLKAAETKWNFNSYRPGLVGGHCISVDPYYLTYKAKELDFKPKMILAGRQINNQIPNYIAEKLLEKIKVKNISLNAKILIMGVTFKENCPDIRNSKVVDLISSIKNLKNNSFIIDVFDPWLSEEDYKNFKNTNIIKNLVEKKYDILILAVNHDYFKELGINKIKKFIKGKSIIFDLKYILKEEESDFRL